jgi:hypothetical protein
MGTRLTRALIAFVFALSFIVNGAAMQVAYAHTSVPAPQMTMAGHAMPCHEAAKGEKHYPCCPQHSPEKASCAADCCMSTVPMTVQATTQFTYVKYQQRPKPALALLSHISTPPSRPPQA